MSERQNCLGGETELVKVGDAGERVLETFNMWTGSSRLARPEHGDEHAKENQDLSNILNQYEKNDPPDRGRDVRHRDIPTAGQPASSCGRSEGLHQLHGPRSNLNQSLKSKYKNVLREHGQL